MKRMLINATQAEEKRLAVVEGQSLLDYETETVGQEQRKSNIYKAVVTRIEPSLEACFVDYGEDRHGFLPFKEISRQYYSAGIKAEEASIQTALVVGQELLVQVEKEERGNKGAALTTFISIAGRYVVLMPNNPRGGGVSRRVEEEDRIKLKETMRQLQYPKGMSTIARTAGIGRSTEELQWDLNYLVKLWSAIVTAADSLKQPSLIYQESNLVIRALRDYFGPDIDEILIDEKNVYEQAKQFVTYVMPEQINRVKFYSGNTALFSRFQIEKQIESAYTRSVSLPSGGSIVIDHTEALVSIDVNSARSIKGSDVEETAIRTNLEAAEEVARQMRLRDLGGLIVIDFIDMDEQQNRRNLESYLRDVLRADRARIHLSNISRFGLIEMSRQRLKPALNESVSIPCPRCSGAGHIRSTDSSALQILRVIQEEAVKDSTEAVLVQVPVDAASFLLNEKRFEISKIEAKERIKIIIVPNKTLETPNYYLDRLKADDPRLENMPVSYQVADDFEENNEGLKEKGEPKKQQKPLIDGVLRDAPLPQEKQISLFTRLWLYLVNLFISRPVATKTKAIGKKKYSNQRQHKKKPNHSTNNNLKEDLKDAIGKEAVAKTSSVKNAPVANKANSNRAKSKTKTPKNANAKMASETQVAVPSTPTNASLPAPQVKLALPNPEPVKKLENQTAKSEVKTNSRNKSNRTNRYKTAKTEVAPEVAADKQLEVVAGEDNLGTTVESQSVIPAVVPVAKAVAPSVVEKAKMLLAKDLDFKLAVPELVQVAARAGLVWVQSDSEKVVHTQQLAQAKRAECKLGRELAIPVIEDNTDLILVQTKVNLAELGQSFTK